MDNDDGIFFSNEDYVVDGHKANVHEEEKEVADGEVSM